MIGLRSAGKQLIETVLANTIAPRSRVRQHAGALILAYHNILPDGEVPVGDLSLHLPQRQFAMQLEALARTHDVVPLAEAVSRCAEPESSVRASRPCAAITFDDAYVGAVTAGVAELDRLNLPATIFVTPSFLEGGTFWWDVLADRNSGLSPAFREEALTAAHGMNDEVRALAAARGHDSHAVPDHARGATRVQISDALARARVTLGSHTWSHPNLNSLAPAATLDELARSLRWLEQFGDRAVSMISYPYGLADERVQQAAHDAGYLAGFMIAGGWARNIVNRFAIPRLNVPAGVSSNGFALRAAGLISG